MIVKDGTLYDVTNEDLELLKSNPSLFWQDIKKIGEKAFSNTSIDAIDIPDDITYIYKGAFSGCEWLKQVVLPKKLESMEMEAFKGCKNLKVVDSSRLENKFNIPDSAFEGCLNLQKINLNFCSFVIGANAFKDCHNLNEIIFPSTLSKISSYAFKNCESLNEINLPQKLLHIVPGAFDNCPRISKVSYYTGLTVDDVFDNLNFDYGYSTSNSKTILSNSPLELDNISHVYDLKKCRSVLWKSKYSFYVKNYEHLIELVDKLVKNKIKLPTYFVNFLIDCESLEYFTKNSDFRFIKGEFKDLEKFLSNFDDEDQRYFLYLAENLGCFCSKKVLDKNGRETQTYVGQIASSILGQLIRSNTLDVKNIKYLINGTVFSEIASQDFLKFIGFKNKEKFVNFEILHELERGYIGIFKNVMENFDLAQQFKVVSNNSGKPINLPWKEALLNFHIKHNYGDNVGDDKELADLYLSKGVEEDAFLQAKGLMAYIEKKNIPEHLLSVPLKEKSILESVEEIRENTKEELLDAEKLIEDLYSKKFTYEWLSKYDFRNGILGLYTDCCANLNSPYYGNKIAKYSIKSKHIQNLVVKDSQNRIVAKCTLYINPHFGYGVINDFEIDRKYKKGQILCEPGEYTSEKNSPEEVNRRLIFNAFMRGIHDFVAQYEIEHPHAPIKQINVGMGHNRLKYQTINYKVASDNLSVPFRYGFNDILTEQRVIYQRSNKKQHTIDR